ncbi:MAG: SGNH/GDSL hydrolase family protein [Rhodopirellula sp.]|nr:SGNH/GDSL hydrolase family protein [Rhodopirellula sp.]
MIRRTLKSLKPVSLALLVLVLAPCVVEFAFRITACRSQLTTCLAKSQLATSPSWYTHHELNPMQRISVPGDTDQPPVELRTNSIGLRGPEIRIPKPAGTLRILCLGDEAVLGSAVDEPQTFCSLIQNRLQSRATKKLEVINGGVPDFCPLLNYLQFRHRLLILEPDIIIAHFDMSDVWDDHRFRRLTELNADEEPLLCAAPGLSSVPITKPFTQNFMSWQWAQNKVSGLIDQKQSLNSSSVDAPRSRYAWLTDESSIWTLQAELALSPLAYLADLCQEQGIRLLVAVHPAPWQLSATASRGARIPDLNGIYPGTLIETTRPEELVTRFTTAAALPLCDAISIFRSNSSIDDLYQTDSTQFSEAGHRYYAAALTASLLEHFPGIVSRSDKYPTSDQPAEFAQPAPLHQPDRFTQQPLDLHPVRPAAFSIEAQGAANRPTSPRSVNNPQLHNAPANALVPYSDRR